MRKRHLSSETSQETSHETSFKVSCFERLKERRNMERLKERRNVGMGWSPGTVVKGGTLN